MFVCAPLKTSIEMFFFLAAVTHKMCIASDNLMFLQEAHKGFLKSELI